MMLTAKQPGMMRRLGRRDAGMMRRSAASLELSANHFRKHGFGSTCTYVARVVVCQAMETAEENLVDGISQWD